MPAIDVLGVIEAAYRVEDSPAAWLRGVLAAASPQLDRGLGAAAYFVDVSAPDRFVTSGYVGDGSMGSAEGVARFEAWARAVPVATERHLHLVGAADMIRVTALDESGRGCALTAAVPAGAAPGVPFGGQAMLDRVTAHVAAGARISRALHHRGPTTARDALRSAATRIDQQRPHQQRLSAADAGQAWDAVSAGQWALVDSFEHDGRRYYLAHPGDRRPVAGPALSVREAEIAGAVGRGLSNKAIAYQLGLSTSSVATHVARARVKLGVDSRVELVRACARTRSR